jgi:hypothetical protein
MDLKSAVAEALIEMLEPVRKCFEGDDLESIWGDTKDSRTRG